MFQQGLEHHNSYIVCYFTHIHTHTSIGYQLHVSKHEISIKLTHFASSLALRHSLVHSHHRHFIAVTNTQRKQKNEKTSGARGPRVVLCVCVCVSVLGGWPETDTATPAENRATKKNLSSCRHFCCGGVLESKDGTTTATTTTTMTMTTLENLEGQAMPLLCEA
ncbi:hypothetical protein, no similarity [Maudiozyma saulgeensis]|uniref:Uncharacterized protein n=1 Tax=Maudiozyma saulgeensis TaxID=1789683 RepID=A0A1X7R8N7_9SACH|nr:hypothetical protein, no similarity [Kazachstania saulgeensis]